MHDNKITIREYQERDLEQIIKLMIDFQEYIVSIDNMGIAKQFDNESDCRKYVEELLKDSAEREGVFYVALDLDIIVGFVQGIIDRHTNDLIYSLSHRPGDHGWIGELYVDTEYRGRGVARQLVETISSFFNNKGCVNVRLNAMAENKSALKVHEKLGFIVRNVELVKYDKE